MKFLDLQADNARSQAAIEESVKAVMEHGRFVLGPEVSELEQRLANYIGVKHALCVSSGTSALHVALLALGIGPGDEVITSPFSFFASAEVILMTGAKAVFVDIDPKTYNLDPNLLSLAITERTKAIMPVSLYGLPAEFDAINAIAKQHGLPVIEDGAQSFGSDYQQRKSCGLSTIGCTSFYPTKPFGAMGDGGACFTNDDELAEQMRLVHNHGQSAHYQHTRLGLNYRMNTLQAAILLAKLADFDLAIEKRWAVAAQYDQALAGIVTTPARFDYSRSVTAQYTIQVAERDRVRHALSEQDIPTAVHYPICLHQQGAIEAFLDQRQRFPHAERASQEVISLPFYPEMRGELIERVAEALSQLL